MKLIKLLITSVLALSLVACTSNEGSSESKYDPATFTYVEDLRSLPVDMMAYNGFSDTEHAFRKLGFEESFRFFDEAGTGILFYGYPGCASCTQAVPVLNDVAKELGQTIYYVDISAEEFKQEYVDKLGEAASEFVEKDENGVPQLFVPFVLSVVNGEVIDAYTGSISSSNAQLNESESKQLAEIYHEVLEPFQK